jgi:hypothetical protein
MPIFAHRRLQSMIDEIGPKMDAATLADLLKRLQNIDTTSVLAAEAELALLWAISDVTEIELHPVLSGTQKVPEAFCAKLFPSGPVYIEVTAVSDDTFSDRDKMERAANIISQFANQIRKGSSKHLHFHFMEKSGYETGRYRRYRRITSTFKLTEPFKTALLDWLSDSDWPNPAQIRLAGDEADVIISWREYVHPEGRTFSSMPAVACDLESNPIFNRLKGKRSQLAGVPPGSLKCIFLVDVGCDLLRELRRKDHAGRTVSGEDIIQSFLKKSSIDIIVVCSPHRANLFYPYDNRRIWHVTYFDRRGSLPSSEYEKLRAVAEKLPMPQYEGYQARSLHRQGLFHPQARGRYLPTQYTSRGLSMTVKLSSRLILEFLAGRITAERFALETSNVASILDSMLKAGLTIQSSRLEKGGLDEDDDYLVFDLEPDAAASLLTAPPQSKSAE